MFSCWFSCTEAYPEIKHIIEYYIINENETITVEKSYTWTCDQTESYTGSDTDDSYSLNVTVAISESTRNFMYNFSIHEVDAESNNSILSCSVEAQDQIQWQKNATLLLTSNATFPVNTALQTSNVSALAWTKTGSSRAIMLSAGGAIAVTVLLVLTSSLAFLAWLWWRSKMTTSYVTGDGKWNRN